MPGKIQRTAQFGELEILRFPSPAAEASVLSVTLDATALTYVEGVRNRIPAGTILMKSSTRPTRYTTYDGATGSEIEGILKSAVDYAAAATQGDEAAPMYRGFAVFATEAIVGFTQYAAALLTALPTCRFE